MSGRTCTPNNRPDSVLTISIINYKNWRATAQCIADVVLACEGLDYRILVRDNSEISETVQPQNRLPQASYEMLHYESPDNPGFGGGHNRNFHAVKHGADDVFLVLNNDIRIPGDGVIKAMMQACARNRIVSCVIETPTGEVWLAGGMINRLTGDLVAERKTFAHSVRSADFISGCCLMIPSALYGLLGGFDERFFMYAEDLDLCLRARQLAVETVVVKQRIIHQVGSGEKGRYSDLYLYQNTKNRLLCLRRHRLGIHPINIVYFVVKYGVIRSAQLALHSRARIRQIGATWRGLWEGYRTRRDTLSIEKPEVNTALSKYVRDGQAGSSNQETLNGRIRHSIR
jgi:N-acetylglucosaminyl-diphospho-decaprenol L-rhamnosyltransferase